MPLLAALVFLLDSLYHELKVWTIYCKHSVKFFKKNIKKIVDKKKMCIRDRALAVNVATAIQATVIGSVCSVLKKVTFNSAGSFFKEPFFKIIIFTSVLG